MSETGKQHPTPGVQEDKEEVALDLEHSQNPKKKAHHPTAEYGELVPQVTTGASGGYMKGSSVAGVQYGHNFILNFQGGCTSQELETTKRRVQELGVQFETILSSLTPAPSPALVTSKKQDLESGEDNTDVCSTEVLNAEREDGSEVTDDELYDHFHQCDVSDEDIQSLTDKEVYNYVINVLAYCNIRTSEGTCSSDTLGIKMRVKSRQYIHEEDPPSAEEEEIISDVKLKSNIKRRYRSGNQGTDLLDGVNSKKQIHACTTAEGGQHHLNDVRPRKLGEDSSTADSGLKQLDAACVETLMEDHSKADSRLNAVYSEECTKGGNPDMKAGVDLLLPSPVHPLDGLPGNYLEFTFDLRRIQSRRVRVITRHNVEKNC